ncbi:hypothetical protein [Bacillus atrophaeus]|nr:hypothetical protein [Bacillus atrophaeus]
MNATILVCLLAPLLRNCEQGFFYAFICANKKAGSIEPAFYMNTDYAF